MSHLGSARKIVATKENTTIIEGRGNKEDIEARIERIRQETKTTESEFDKEKLQERLGKLSGGVAVIKVGAATEVEQKARQHKVDDALSAARAAREEGVAPGGGVALAMAALITKDIAKEQGKELSDLEKKGYFAGYSIIEAACQAPLRQIIKNAGADEVALYKILKQIDEEKAKKIKQEGKIDWALGYDAISGKIVNMIEVGILDPTKVIRTALENAASAASMFLTTEVVVADLPEKEEKGKKIPGMPPGY
jgi:chaperonin GroEL